VTSSDPMPNTGSGSGSSRRPRAEAPRSDSVRVRLSPVEATVVGEAAARAGMSLGAWVGHAAVDRARAQVAGDEPDEAGVFRKAEPSSWRELVAALVALRAEVAAMRRVPVVEFEPGAPADELPDSEPSHGAPGGAGRAGVVELLRRIDTVTAATVEAMSSSTRRASPTKHSVQS
jgi:uncharacterized protein (DUF1778 family)